MGNLVVHFQIIAWRAITMSSLFRPNAPNHLILTISVTLSLMAKLMDQLLNVLYYLGGYWRVNIGAKYVFVICTWLVMSVMWTKENTKGKNSCNILVWQYALQFHFKYDSVIFLLFLLLISYYNLFFYVSGFYLLQFVLPTWYLMTGIGGYGLGFIWIALVGPSRFPYLPA